MVPVAVHAVVVTAHELCSLADSRQRMLLKHQLALIYIYASKVAQLLLLVRTERNRLSAAAGHLPG